MRVGVIHIRYIVSVEFHGVNLQILKLIMLAYQRMMPADEYHSLISKHN
jgi:hypothetical protein